MTQTIYALVDPNTREVKYVGRTSKTVAERLNHHVGAARRGSSKPVYAWIRSLAPGVPIIVILQTVEYTRVKRKEGGYESVAASTETKWMKRFERSRIFNQIDRSTGVYRRLVNPG